MTTPKPASAPPVRESIEWAQADAEERQRFAASAPPADSLPAIVAEMRRLSAGFDNGEVLIEDWADRIEAIAATQVREVEPLTESDCCDVCHEPLTDECACQHEYNREHDRYAER